MQPPFIRSLNNSTILFKARHMLYHVPYPFTIVWWNTTSLMFEIIPINGAIPIVPDIQKCEHSTFIDFNLTLIVLRVVTRCSRPRFTKVFPSLLKRDITTSNGRIVSNHVFEQQLQYPIALSHPARLVQSREHFRVVLKCGE